MAVHIISVTEPELHEESSDCICEPRFHIDEETGEMVWEHQLLDYDRLIDGLIE